jgi:Ca2+-transporting ATPase
MSEQKKFWSRSSQSILESFEVDAQNGLSSDDVEDRREKHGPNKLRSAETRSAWQIWIEQFKSLVVLLLVAASVLSFAFGDVVEGFAIVFVILINASIGFVTELRAVRSMEALQEMGSVEAKVRRDGAVHEIAAEEIVPGDIVLVEGGDIVTADLRLVEANKLQADEAALTGESVPVGKQTDPLEEDVPLAERDNMLFKGTAVTRGSGKGIAVATGMDTEIGQISSLVEEAEEEATPLEKRLDRLSRKLIMVTLGIAALVAVGGVVAGRELIHMVETAVALAVASIPEGLPIVATIALARGMRRMAKRNALINKLSAVETLGATNIILTDKTGTLTENRMTVTQYILPGGEIDVSGEGLKTEGEFRDEEGNQITPEESELLREAVRVGVLCNNASLPFLNGEVDEDESKVIGDPMEVALLIAGVKAGMRRGELLEQMPETREVAFDPEVKMMATLHEQNGGYKVAVKGSPDAVLEACSHILSEQEKVELTPEQVEKWREHNEQMAGEGLRVIAMAAKTVENADADPYEKLTFLGLAGLIDPPREEVIPAIQSCQDAGIRVVMATGDQPLTAVNVARSVNLIPEDKDEEDVGVIRGSEFGDRESWSEEESRRILETDIFSRVSPKQKLDLIDAHQESGAVVAMTGDGVNDAPALKKADIGVAMGERGTQVAREAADMILEDDAFSSIVVAVRQGRVIFNNIRKFVLYLLSCNISEVMVVGFAALLSMPLPIRPMQILFLNLVTDVFPALALGVGEGSQTIMKRPPRDPDESILTRSHWIKIGSYGTLLTVAVLAALFAALSALGMANEQAVTISFLTLAFAQLWNVFNMRDQDSDLVRNEITQNRWIWGALALCTVLLLLAVYVPFLANILGVVRPGAAGWAVVLVASLAPLVVGQIGKYFDIG